MLFLVKFGAIKIYKKEHQYNINFHNLKNDSLYELCLVIN